MEDLVFATLKELVESTDNTEHQDHLPPFHEGYKDDINVIFYDLFDELDGKYSSGSDKE